MAKKAQAIEKDVLQNLEPIAKALQKGAAQLWKMFVMRYVAKGVSQVFLAIFINWVGYVYFWPDLRYWMLIPLGIGGILVYDAIQLLANPYYFAMNDVAYRIKNEHLFGDK